MFVTACYYKNTHELVLHVNDGISRGGLHLERKHSKSGHAYHIIVLCIGGINLTFCANLQLNLVI